MGSTRFPGKVMTLIRNKPLLYYVINQIRGSALNPQIVVATTVLPADDVIADYSHAQGVEVFRGNENDVLDRFYHCAKKFSADTIVRICADSPFIDYNILDSCIKKFQKSNVDYLSNIITNEGKEWKENHNGFPIGTAVEVFSFKTLEKAWTNSTDPYEREHVTVYIIRHPEFFKLDCITNSDDFSKYRLVVDYKEDLDVVNTILSGFSENTRLTINQIIHFLQNRK